MITKLFHMFKDAILKVSTLLENFVTSYPELAIAVGTVAALTIAAKVVIYVIKKRKERSYELELKKMLANYFCGTHKTTVTFQTVEEVE